jgi:hypothetical protein
VKSKEGFIDILCNFLLPITTPIDKWPAMELSMSALERQERMEHQNLLIINLLRQIRDKL